jgi:cytochrome b6-f complex iron-sulfur subunit
MTLAKKSNTITRRQFIGLAWAAATVALFAQAGGALYQFLKPTVPAGAFGGKVSAGNVKEFAVGSVSTVREMHGFVSRVSDKGALVMSWRCTHLGCTVPWVDAENQFHCPCHGSIYDPKGEVLAGPAPRPLDLYSAEVVDEELIVDTSSVKTRDHYDDSQLTPFPPGA